MRRIAILIYASFAVLLCAQPKPKPQKHKVEKHQPDPEDRWICRIGSYHDCSCLAMVAEANEAWIAKCSTEKDYAACMAKKPANCDVIQTADAKHPAHSCKRTCKTMAGCQCDDGPVCKGPIIHSSSDGIGCGDNGCAPVTQERQ